MSSAAVVPPPNTTSILRHVPRLTARAKALLTAINLHFAGIAALSVIVLYLIAHFFFITQSLRSQNEDARQQQRVELRAAQIAALPLRGLDGKLITSTEAADEFYAKRLQYGYAEVAAELGVLTKREGVRLARVTYAQSPALTVKPILDEVKMDAAVSGDYRSIVHFINAVERDKKFFVITGINLTGQQSGQVNLRMRMTTYLRTPNEKEQATELALPEAAAAKPVGGLR